jgi:hypothetical protein
MNHSERHHEVLAAVKLVKPILAGKEPSVQGAVLAELLAIYLAGHWIPGDPHQTQELRDSILVTHCAYVRQLAIVNAGIMGTDQ